MSKPAKIVGVYQIGMDEALHIEVTVPGDAHPDQLSEERATVSRLMHDVLADVIAQVHTTSE